MYIVVDIFSGKHEYLLCHNPVYWYDSLQNNQSDSNSLESTCSILQATLCKTFNLNELQHCVHHHA